MTGSSDIAKLFKSFGGSTAADYQEIVEHDRQDASRTRWPMLEEIPLHPPSTRKLMDQPTPAPEPGRPTDPAPLPSFRSLRVLSPASENAGNSASGHDHTAQPQPPGGRLQDVFKRLGHEPEPVAAEKPTTSLFKKAPASANGISTMFQRLRRP